MKKEYYFFDSKFLGVVAYLMAYMLPVALLACFWGDIKRLGTIFVILVFYWLTPAKYFPVLSSLVIDEQSVRKKTAGITARRILRSEVYVGSIYFVDTRFLIFSKVPLGYASRRRIKWLVFIRKAFLFPEKSEMYQDFPELFSNVTRIIY